jgi:hypothetical protein
MSCEDPDAKFRITSSRIRMRKKNYGSTTLQAYGRDLTNDVHGEGDEPVMPDQEGEEVAPVDHNAKLFHQRFPVEEIVRSWKKEKQDIL